MTYDRTEFDVYAADLSGAIATSERGPRLLQVPPNLGATTS